MGIYERIAMLEGIAKTKRVELEVIEAEIKRWSYVKKKYKLNITNFLYA